jgi:hypothetical protein
VVRDVDVLDVGVDPWDYGDRDHSLEIRMWMDGDPSVLRPVGRPFALSRGPSQMLRRPRRAQQPFGRGALGAAQPARDRKPLHFGVAACNANVDSA